jgi:hypothetical protein
VSSQVPDTRGNLRQAVAVYSLEPTQMNEDLVNLAIRDFELAVRLEDVEDFHRRFEAAVRERAA